MKPATISEIKKELLNRSSVDLLEFCLGLSRFKKENKELLSYLLFKADDEAGYIEEIKNETIEEFQRINTSSYYYIKKSVRKILRRIKTHIRYSKKKETEVELLIFYCQQLQNLKPSIYNNIALLNLYKRQIIAINRILPALHEDLQYDYGQLMSELDTQID